jgi:3-oxoacyl-[acyl-carrier protein] reductase
MDVIVLEISDKVAIITGAGQGIGRGVASNFACEGGKIVVVDIKRESTEETVRMIESKGLEAIPFVADVSRIEDVKKLVRKTVDLYGRIDILVNNVGIYPVTLMVDMTEEEWDRVILIDLKTVFICSREVIPFMIKQRAGKIVNIASVTGPVVGYPGQTHYSAAKAGVVGFTRSLALELAKYNINVNAIAPGVVTTPGVQSLDQFVRMAEANPLKRLGTPLDVANAALFLASERSDYVTGQIIVVDGGNSIQEFK